MRRIICLLMIVACFNARAQNVSLTDAEIMRLRNLIKTDSAARRTFKKFEDQAAKALKETPDPIEEITSEGMLAGHPDKVKSLKAVEDVDKIYALAFVYRMRGDIVYMDKATEYLLAWAKVNKSSGDPIDETKLENLFTGYDLLRSAMTPDAQRFVDAWLDSIAAGELNSEYAKDGEGTAINNWNSHRLKIIAMIAYAIHSKNYDDFLVKAMEKQIAINLYADGSGHDFKERDALHYHIYTLEPLTMAAIVIKRATGKDLFNYQSVSGSSIKKSMDFLVPFVTGEKEHGEFFNSKAAFDKARAQNGEKGYSAGAKFHANTGIYVLELASYFDKKYADVVFNTFPKGNHTNDWQILLNKVRKP